MPTLGAVRLEACKPHTVKALLGRKRAEGLSERTVAKIRRHMHAMFAFAQDAGLVSINPASAPRARGPRQRRRARGVALIPEQIAAFLEECSCGRDGKMRSDARWRLFFTVALDTGLRRSELVGLRWEDVDLANRVIHVRRSIGNYDDPEQMGEQNDDDELTTKTDAGMRLVPILDGALAALGTLHASVADPRPGAPVFATIERKRGRDGVQRPIGRPLSPRMVSRVFRRYADRAGLPKNVRLHEYADVGTTMISATPRSPTRSPRARTFS